MTDHPARLGTTPMTVEWRARHQTLFLYEVDLDALVPHVPDAVTVQEVRPGVGLLAIESLHYLPGHFADPRESVEIVVAVLVEPDLTVQMPVPQFSLFVTSVLSSSAAFVEHERMLLRTPMEHAPDLRMSYAPDGASVAIFEGETPIVECRNTRAPAVFAPKVMWGLIYSNKQGELHRGAFRWEGNVFEHQQRGGDVGRLHPHPVFRGLDVSRVRGCYRQMAAQPDLPTRIAYYHVGRAP